MIRKLYPYGKKKTFNVTYDDGVLQDIRFVELLNRYNMKGTFNLNSALMENEFEWTHESGCVVKRIGTEEAISLYEGHEVASHTLTHPYMKNLTKEEILHELSQDKINLEKVLKKEIQGFAIPFDYYSDLIKKCVKECNFAYARISGESYSFIPQKDFYKWRATIFHCNDRLESFVKEFIETDEELALFQIVGHSYDLDVENKWDELEDVFRIVSCQDDILPMTTIEMVRYLEAMEKTEITDKYILNNSDRSLWFDINNTVCEIMPKEKYVIGGRDNDL